MVTSPSWTYGSAFLKARAMGTCGSRSISSGVLLADIKFTRIEIEILAFLLWVALVMATAERLAARP